MKSYGTLVGELPIGVEFVLEGALLRITLTLKEEKPF